MSHHSVTLITATLMRTTHISRTHSIAPWRIRCFEGRGKGHLHLSTDAGKELAQKIGLVYQLNIAPKVIGSDEQIYIVDLKQGKITKGPYDGNPDATFSFKDSDFLAIVSGKLNPRIAYIRGAIKVEGGLAAMQKFTLDLFPKPSKL